MSRWNRPPSLRFISTALLAAALAGPAAALLPTGAEPRFHIQAIEVRGAKHVSPAIVASESLLEAGQVYTESELRDAVDRIRRLPFLLDVGFALGKGSERGSYVLVVDVHETRRFFFALDLAQTWLGEPLAIESEGALDDNLTSTATAGARLFLGRYGMLFAAAGNEGARLGFTRYNLFRKNVVLSLGLSAETCCATAIAPLGLDPVLSSWIDEEGAESATVSLGVPLGAHQSVAGSLAVRESKRGFRRPALGRPGAGDDLLDFRDRREEEVRLTWSYDTTDDPVVPAEGTTLAVSVGVRTLAADLAPAAGAAAEMSSEQLRLSVLGQRHWPFARRHSFAAGLSLAVGRGEVENLPVSARELVNDSLASWELTATIRHSLRLNEAKRARRLHDVVWQNVLEYSVESTSPGLISSYGVLDYGVLEVAAFSSAVIIRNDWGVFRFGIRVIDMGNVL